MKSIRIFLISTLCISALSIYGQNTIGPVPAKDVQIKIAMQAAPSEQAEGAKVLGYDSDGQLITLREGKNDLICLADDPSKNDIHVACYHKELEPFMARGRELKAEGHDTKEIRSIRGKEADAGTLKMPEKPASLSVFDADQEDVDITTGEVTRGRLRSVIHTPYLTGEQSGLPTNPVGGGMPWLMDAGTHRSHIMITPPKN